ncbi:HAD-IA family hydrolase [Bifidobacterium callimiconis]|nr:HAD-IA family hydrolase [Bifidobacterium callimiconis]
MNGNNHDSRGDLNVVFDFCDVLLNWDPKSGTYDLLAGEFGVDAWRDFYDEDAPYGMWHYDGLLDIGLDPAEAAADYRAHHRGEDCERMFDVYYAHREQAFRGMITGMDTLLNDLARRGVPVWGLTNFTQDAVDYATAKYPSLRLLRDVVVSSTERLKKPDHRIYELAAERFGIDPGRSVFIDDKMWNVRGAKESGFRSFVFTNALDARAQLAQFGAFSRR